MEHMLTWGKLASLGHYQACFKADGADILCRQGLFAWQAIDIVLWAALS